MLYIYIAMKIVCVLYCTHILCSTFYIYAFCVHFMDEFYEAMKCVRNRSIGLLWHFMDEF